MAGRFARTYKDYDGESSTMAFPIAAITAANYDAQLALQATFVSALVPMMASTPGLAKTTWGNVVEASGVCDNPLAQRETKWLVQYHDYSTNTKGVLEIPCANLNKLDANDRANAAIGDEGEVDAFVAALEAYMLSPAGNAIVVDEITFVARNT
jgi:hypothetical protein